MYRVLMLFAVLGLGTSWTFRTMDSDAVLSRCWKVNNVLCSNTLTNLLFSTAEKFYMPKLGRCCFTSGIILFSWWCFLRYHCKPLVCAAVQCRIKHGLSIWYPCLCPLTESVPVYHHYPGHRHGGQLELWLVQHSHSPYQHHWHQRQSSRTDSQNGES